MHIFLTLHLYLSYIDHIIALIILYVLYFHIFYLYFMYTAVYMDDILSEINIIIIIHVGCAYIYNFKQIV